MIYQTEIKEHSGLRVRVQLRQCLDGSIQQRHIYYADDRFGEYDPPWVQPWIPSYTRNWQSASRGFRAAPDVKDELDELLTALQEIAAGHNDARGRAQEALRNYDAHRV